MCVIHCRSPAVSAGRSGRVDRTLAPDGVVAMDDYRIDIAGARTRERGVHGRIRRIRRAAGGAWRLRRDGVERGRAHHFIRHPPRARRARVRHFCRCSPAAQFAPSRQATLRCIGGSRADTFLVERPPDFQPLKDRPDGSRLAAALMLFTAFVASPCRCSPRASPASGDRAQIRMIPALVVDHHHSAFQLAQLRHWPGCPRAA